MFDLTLKLVSQTQASSGRLDVRGFDIRGFFVESENIGRWLEIALSLCADPMRCDFFPIRIHGRLKGVFLRDNAFEEQTTAKESFVTRIMNPLRPAGLLTMKPISLPDSLTKCQLWVPLESSLSPVPLSHEWGTLMSDRLGVTVWHPALGLISIDPLDRIGIESLIAPPESRSVKWNKGVEGTAVPERLVRVDAPHPPTLEQWLEKARDGLGDRSGELKLLPASKREMRGKPLESLGAMSRSVAGKVAAWIADQIDGLANRNSGKKRPRNTNPVQPTSVAGSAQPNRKAAATAQWVQAIHDWAKRQMDQWNETLQARREASVSRLLEMLDRNPEEGLRYAIPMSDELGRGLGAPGADLVARDLRWGMGSSGGVDNWSLGWAAQKRLRDKYLELARRELNDGRYERAASIYAQLLGDFHQAAQALEKGQLFRQAAVIYRERLKNDRKAADLYCRAGDFDTAIGIYQRMALHIEAGDLLLQLGQPELANAEYRKHLESLISQSRPCEAADLLVIKLKQPDEALALLANHWPKGPQSRNCAQKSFDLLSQLDRHDDSVKQIDRLVSHPGIAELGVWPSELLSSLANSYPEASVREVAQRRLFVYASQFLESTQNGNAMLAVAAALCKSVPEDRLLQRDAHRFAQDRRRALTMQTQGKKTPLIVLPKRTFGRTLEPVETVSLSREFEWFGMLVTERGPLCFGHRDGTLLVQPTFPSDSPKNGGGMSGGVEIRSFFKTSERSHWLRSVGRKTRNGESFHVIVGPGRGEVVLGEGNSYWYDDALVFKITAANEDVYDCFCSQPNDAIPHDEDKQTLFLSSYLGQVCVGLLDGVGHIKYSTFSAIDMVRDFKAAIESEEPSAMSLSEEEEDRWMHAQLMARRWCIATHNHQLILSCGSRMNIYDHSQIAQCVDTSSPIESVQVSNRFTRPRVILGLESGVMMQWLKADEYRSCMIDDLARNSKSCFVRTGHIAIAHDAGIDLYSNQGFQIKRVASHSGEGGFAAIGTENNAFWTLTKVGAVQKWETQ